VKGSDNLVSVVFGEIASSDKLQSGWLVSWPRLNPGPLNTEHICPRFNRDNRSYRGGDFV